MVNTPPTEITDLIESLDISNEADKKGWISLASIILKDAPKDRYNAFLNLYDITTGRISSPQWQHDERLSLGISVLLTPLKLKHKSSLVSEEFFKLQTFITNKLIIKKEELKSNISTSNISKTDANDQLEYEAAPQLGTLRILYNELAHQYAARHSSSNPQAKQTSRETLARYMLENSLRNATLDSTGNAKIAGMFNKFIQLRSRGEKLKPTTSLETEDYSLLNILSDNSIDIQEVSQTPLYQYITSNLTEREQSIFTMKYIDGMKNKDIAAELDAKVSTTNVHVFRIKSKIQSLVSKVTLDERSGRVISKKVALATKLDKMAARKGLHIGAQPKYTSWSEKLDEIAKDKGIDTIISPYTRH